MDISGSSAPHLQLPIVPQPSTGSEATDSVPPLRREVGAKLDGVVLPGVDVCPDGAQPVVALDQLAQPHAAGQIQVMQQQIDKLTLSLAAANQTLERLSAVLIPPQAVPPAAPAPATVTAGLLDDLRRERRFIQLDLNRAQRENPDDPEVESYKDGLSQIHADIQATSDQLLSQVAQAAPGGVQPSLAQHKSNLALLRHERNMIQSECKLATLSGLDADVTNAYRDLLGRFATAITDASHAYTAQLTAQSGLAGAAAQPAVPTPAADPLLNASQQVRTGAQSVDEGGVNQSDNEQSVKLHDIEVTWNSDLDDPHNGAPSMRFPFGSIRRIESDDEASDDALSELSEDDPGTTNANIPSIRPALAPEGKGLPKAQEDFERTMKKLQEEVEQMARSPQSSTRKLDPFAAGEKSSQESTK